MNKELLLILKTLRKADVGILISLCFIVNCQNIKCDICIFNILKYTYPDDILSTKYIKTIEVLIEQ